MRIKRGGIYRHVSERAFHRKYEDLGYEIIEETEEKEELADKTVDELREKAKELELSGYYSMRKDELIAEIEKVE